MEQITDLLDMNTAFKQNRSTSRLGHNRSQTRVDTQQSSASISPMRNSNSQIGGKIAPVSRMNSQNEYGL